ncbi:hypothetical protein SteCoe_18074 [Stentor coeruleus]|uniref:J domain-containing protein n=1 Tax=Stentor coeruleus TaxID=5963 RepID=A0A1R2BXW4_9CILI|nr:hypothetical protein SteCoe_18074 [Stentor coeruleus]
MKMSLDHKKFNPNLSNCRSRKNSVDSRPRADSSSSSDEMSLFCLKNQEYNFGPKLQPHKRVRTGTVAPQLGKNLDIHFAPDMVCEEVGMEDDDFIHLARSIAEQNGGVCLSETCENENFPLVYKCKMGHVWESSDVLLSHSWCWKCLNLLERAKNYAACYEGNCVSKSCELLLEFECRNGHRWKADLTRYMHQKWCKQCILDEKHQMKLKFLQEQRAEEEEQARIQEKLFAEARQEMKNENTRQAAESEQEVEYMAEAMAKRYIESTLIKDIVAIEQVTCLYKIICASENFIKAKYFSKPSKDQVTAAYRQLARILHPDKNKHPLAADAFLKISSIYAATMANA